MNTRLTADEEQIEKDKKAVKELTEILEKDKDKRLRMTRASLAASVIDDDEDKNKKD
jgi:hypothetical protein